MVPAARARDVRPDRARAPRSRTLHRALRLARGRRRCDDSVLRDMPMTTWKPRRTVGQMVEDAKKRIENLSVEQVEAEMARGDVQAVDLRDVRERRKLGFIPGSTHVPRAMLAFCLHPPPPHSPGNVCPTNRI